MKTREIIRSSNATRTPGAMLQSLKIFSLLAVTLLAFSTEAQTTNTMRFRASQIRFTVNAGSGSSTTTSNWVAVGSLGGVPVTVTVSGLPSGATCSLSTNGTDFSSSIVTSDSTNIFLQLDTTGSLAKGVYTFSVNMAGGNESVTNYMLLTLQSGTLDSFSGTTSTDDVILTDASGANDNVTVTHSIGGDTTAGSVRFSQYTAGTKFQYINIDPGFTLSLVGTNGFSLLRDFVEDNDAGSQLPNLGAMTVTIAGSNNATMLVSNSAANFALLIPAQIAHTLNMAGLDNLKVNVNRFGLGDYSLWPNFYNLQDNSYNGIPKRFLPTVNLARTNVITTLFVDPNNYTNAEDRQYGVTFLNSLLTGTTTQPNVRLGVTNAIFADGVCFVHANQQGNLSFNTAFATNNPTAIFRGIYGTNRMSMFAISDEAGTNTANSNIKATIDFGSSGGTVDILTDRFYIARDRKRYSAAGQPNIQGSFVMGKGLVDVNNAILGFQEHCCHTNEIEFRGYCQGAIIVSNTAVFRVNNTLTLGYNVESNVFATPSQNYGRVTLSSGGTLSAGTILVGGPAKFAGDGTHSTDNNITVNSGSTLILSNTIADGDQKLSNLTMSGANLTLHINGFITNIFVTNLTASLPDTIIDIGSVSGVGASYPITVSLISYDVNNGANFTVSTNLQSLGLYGSINDDVANKLITLTLDTNPPTPLVWRGNTSSVWDTATTNWVTQGGGVPNRFHNGDFVIFDDTATGSTEITVGETVVPGQSPTSPGILISNSTLHYTFNGSSPINGSASTRKVGTARFTNNVVMQGSFTLNGGTFAGSGSIGSTRAEEGTTMTAFTGTINGGLTASNAAVSISGTVNGGLTLRAGGLTNNGTINGTMSLTTNVFLTNGNIINVTVPWTITSNTTVINNGTIAQTPNGANNGLTINGNLRGSGKIVLASGAIADARVIFGPGGTLTIGNSPGEITTMTLATRVDFNAGSKTTIDVDTSTTNDTILLEEPMVSSGKVNFGQNSSAGGVFIINKTGGPAFATNTTLRLFDKTSNPTPDNTAQALPGVTPAPGTSLTWDVSEMITNLLLKVTAPPYMTNGYNGSNSFTFSWPENYRGFRLERQAGTLTNGLSPYITNWATVATSFGGSNGGNNLYFPDTNDLSIKYFRAVRPVTTATNIEFYRLAYP